MAADGSLTHPLWRQLMANAQRGPGDQHHSPSAPASISRCLSFCLSVCFGLSLCLSFLSHLLFLSFILWICLFSFHRPSLLHSFLRHSCPFHSMFFWSHLFLSVFPDLLSFFLLYHLHSFPPPLQNHSSSTLQDHLRVLELLTNTVSMVTAKRSGTG